MSPAGDPLFDCSSSLARLVDCGPFAQGWPEVSTVGCGASSTVGSLQCSMGESLEQSCPDHRNPVFPKVAPEVSPCPCDRWCETSG